MRLRTRIALAFLILSAISYYYFFDWIIGELKPRYREAIEESVVDSAELVAGIISQTSDGQQINLDPIRQGLTQALSRPLDARIYDFLKKSVDLRLYVTDHNGKLLYDSRGIDPPGTDYSKRNDVYLTLQGKYGARTTRDIKDDSNTTVFFVGAPIIIQGQTVGVVSVGKPARNNNLLAARAQRKLLIGARIGAITTLILIVLVSLWISSPLHKLTTYVRALRDGQRMPRPKIGGVELQELALAFDQMREALDGKKYVENYVQTLTHELKSPIAAIKGAAELLAENPAEEHRVRFVQNIGSEVGRMEDFVDRLLRLSSIERKSGLEELQEVDLVEIVLKSQAQLSVLAEQKKLQFKVAASQPMLVVGDSELLNLAVSNLLKNAIEFSPFQGIIEISVQATLNQIVLVIRDQGPGIPEYARARIGERFYSLQRPDTGKKSSGLGLSIVKEIMQLHQGNLIFENRQGGGAEVQIQFTQARAVV